VLGDAMDVQRRLRALLPPRWFSEDSPNLSALLNSLANPWSWIYQFIQYISQQSRIATATDHWLDLIATDFFGSAAARLDQEPDAAYRGRIQYLLLRKAGTRSAIVSFIDHVTGAEPWVCEPANPADTGSYGTQTAGAPAAFPGAAYGQIGGWGSLSMPLQFFIVVKRPKISGLASIGGYTTPDAGYGVGRTSYADLALLPGAITDQQIYAGISDLLPVGAIAWARLA
jgi:hypothetical protein